MVPKYQMNKFFLDKITLPIVEVTLLEIWSINFSIKVRWAFERGARARARGGEDKKAFRH